MNDHTTTYTPHYCPADWGFPEDSWCNDFPCRARRTGDYRTAEEIEQAEPTYSRGQVIAGAVAGFAAVCVAAYAVLDAVAVIA